MTTNGEIVAHYDYSPFGEMLIESGDLASSFTHRFSTKPWCPITGLYEYQMRKYRPEIGRWLSRDPLEELSFAVLQELTYSDEGSHTILYAFAGNSSISFIDPVGLSVLQLNYELAGTLPWLPGSEWWGRINVGPHFKNDQTCVAGSISIGLQWQPPFVKKIDKFLFSHTKWHFQFYVRGYGSLEFEKCPCEKCLDSVTLCFNLDVEASAYRTTPGFREGDHFSRKRRGVGGFGEGRVCWNLCNGEVYLHAQGGAYVSLNLGFGRFNRQIDLSWFWQTDPDDGHLFNMWAPLQGKGVCCE